MLKIKWIVRVEITVKESEEEGISILNVKEDTQTFYKRGYVWRLPAAIKYYKKKYPEMKYKIILFPRLNSFFTFF